MVSSRYVYINYFIIFILSDSLSHGSGPLFLKFIYQKQGKNPYLVVPHSRRTKVKVRSRKFDFSALSEFKTLVRCNLQFIARSTIILRFLFINYSVIFFPEGVDDLSSPTLFRFREIFRPPAFSSILQNINKH